VWNKKRLAGREGKLLSEKRFFRIGRFDEYGIAATEGCGCDVTRYLVWDDETKYYEP